MFDEPPTGTVGKNLYSY